MAYMKRLLDQKLNDQEQDQLRSVYNINDLQLDILFNIVQNPLRDFTCAVQQTFRIKDICAMCGIDRNRYNYLVRSRQIHFLYLALKNEVIRRATQKTSS